MSSENVVGENAVQFGRCTMRVVRFPELQCFRGPSGMGFRAFQAAKKTRETKAEFIRVAVEERIARVLGERRTG